ncbi:hypothetical protein LDENG_00018390, partial [Lucifuga dentata]
ELLADALVFRNKYASQPYLPEEIIPDVHKKPFFTTDSDMQWPERSSSGAEFGPGGETIIKSVEGQATLRLSPSGEEFSVKFTCSLSQAHSQHHEGHHHSKVPNGNLESQNQQPLSKLTSQRGNVSCMQTIDEEAKERRGNRRNLPLRSRSLSPQITTHCADQTKPEEMYQSTTVVQHQSCYGVSPMWCYPLSLAHQHQMTRISKPPGNVGTEATTDCPHTDGRTNKLEEPSKDRRSRLPQALPLTCPSPHWHRWKTKDSLSQEEHSHHGFPVELVKVMWCQGVIYRILSGAISVIEVSPGDGSVIRSNGVLNAYFTHHKPELQSGEVKEVTYHLNSLPPDVPGQLYSVRSVVTRASRILTCYNQAKQSLKLPVTPSCLQQDRYFSEPVILEDSLRNSAPVDHYWNVTQTAQSQSNLVAAELEKIQRFNFLLENSNVPRSEKSSPKLEGRSTEEEICEPVNESCIAEALQRTSKVIQDIDALTAITLT